MADARLADATPAGQAPTVRYVGLRIVSTQPRCTSPKRLPLGGLGHARSPHLAAVTWAGWAGPSRGRPRTTSPKDSGWAGGALQPRRPSPSATSAGRVGPRTLAAPRRHPLGWAGWAVAWTTSHAPRRTWPHLAGATSAGNSGRAGWAARPRRHPLGFAGWAVAWTTSHAPRHTSPKRLQLGGLGRVPSPHLAAIHWAGRAGPHALAAPRRRHARGWAVATTSSLAAATAAGLGRRVGNLVRTHYVGACLCSRSVRTYVPYRSLATSSSTRSGPLRTGWTRRVTGPPGTPPTNPTKPDRPAHQTVSPSLRRLCRTVGHRDRRRAGLPRKAARQDKPTCKCR
jgi:hypothetical protein